MDNNTIPQTHDCFKFARPYMKLLGQLTTVAWNTPNLLSEKKVREVRNLCSLTKCEASVWYLLQRARKEKQREAEDGITGMDVQKTLSLVRERKLIYRSDKLIEFYRQNLKEPSMVTQHFHSLRFENKVTDEQEKRARKILTMTSELARLYENDAAFIFYLETGLTANAFRLLGEQPLRYRHLISGYAELDTLKGRRTAHVDELKELLAQALTAYKKRDRRWWKKGAEAEWDNFIGECNAKGWLCTDGEGKPYTEPYMLTDKCCHSDFLFCVVELGLSGKGPKPLRPGDERGVSESDISCTDLAEELGYTFFTRFTVGQVSTARKAVLESRANAPTGVSTTNKHPKRLGTRSKRST